MPTRSLRAHHARAYAAMFTIRLREVVQYRTAVLSSGAISVVFGLINVLVLRVFYLHGSPDGAEAVINGLTLSGAASYTWLVQILIMFIPIGFDGELLEAITSGNVALSLCRPIDFYNHWAVRMAAARTGIGLARVPLTLVVASLLPAGLGLSPPASAAGLWLCLVSVACAFLLFMTFGMLMLVLRLNISWGEGPGQLLMGVASLLSGSLLPLPLWPDALQPFLRIQPFAGYMDTPLRLYTGTLPPAEAAQALALQLVWIAAFWLLGRALCARKLKTLTIQGG